MMKYFTGAIFGFFLGVLATAQFRSALVQAQRPSVQAWLPYILSENVQRIASREQIWKQYNFPNVESYVDFLSLADEIGKRRFARQMVLREARANIDEEYQATFTVLCFIPLPGKPPQYKSEIGQLREKLATNMFTSAVAREAAIKRVLAPVYEMSVQDLNAAKQLTPQQFFK